MPALILAVVLTGCTEDPRSFPFLVVEEYRGLEDQVPVDVDGDGRDEMIYRANPSGGSVWSAVLVTLDGLAIDQANYQGEIVSRPLVIDLEMDGIEEAFIPLVRNDSLFLSQLDFHLGKRDVTKGREIFVVAGGSIVRDGVEYDWDPKIRKIVQLDAEPDESRLVLELATGFAGYPRGFAVLSGKDFSDRRYFLTGAAVHTMNETLAYDSSGSSDLLLTTYASDNGHEFNGYSDARAYVMLVDVDSLTARWHQVLGVESEIAIATRTAIFDSRFNDDEIATATGRSNRLSTIDFRSARSGLIRSSYEHNKAIHDLLALDSMDDEDRLAFTDTGGDLFYLRPEDNGFSTIHLTDDVVAIRSGFDVNNSGEDDLFAFRRSDIEIFDVSGRRLATMPWRANAPRVASVRTGRAEAARLLLTNGDGTYAYRVEPNPWYLFFRYWPVLPLLAALGLLYLPARLTTRVARLRKFASDVEKKVEAQDEKIQNLTDTVLKLQQQTVEALLPKPDAAFPMQIKRVLDKYALDSSFDVEKFGGKLGYSTRQTIRKVKAATGKSPNEVIWLYRIEYAKTLLREGGKTIAEIADASGFKSQAHFSTKFRELEGVRPTEYVSDATA